MLLSVFSSHISEKIFSMLQSHQLLIIANNTWGLPWGGTSTNYNGLWSFIDLGCEHRTCDSVYSLEPSVIHKKQRIYWELLLIYLLAYIRNKNILEVVSLIQVNWQLLKHYFNCSLAIVLTDMISQIQFKTIPIGHHHIYLRLPTVTIWITCSAIGEYLFSKLKKTLTVLSP